MRIGIIGAGNIAGTMATTLQPLYGAQCYAIASRDIKRAKEFADKYGFEKAYGSYADMLSDPGVELVYIATPHSHHYEHIKMCLEHGKHVLCEKAFCANADQAEEVLLMAEERGLLLAEAIWTRYMPMREIINRVIKSGIIGNITSLSANLGYPLIGKARLVRPELAGGALLDLGVYVLNFASMIFGDDIDSIAANCVKLDTGVDAQETIMLTYKDGRMASLYVTMLAQTDRRGLINGTAGYIEIENINNYEMVRVFNLERKIVAEYTAPTQITGYEYEVQSAMKAISNGLIECPEMPHAQILRMMQLMDSIRGAWGIEFPFEKDNTIRITAQDIDPNKRSLRVRTTDDKEVEKQGSVVRKISETSDRPAKDVGSHISAAPGRAGNTDEASVNAGKEQKGTEKEAEKVAQARKILKIKKTVKGKAEAMPAERPVLKEKPKSTTQKLRELGEELRVEKGSSDAGTVTDRIQGLVIDEDKPVDNRSFTGKLRDLSIDDEKERSIKEFQRRRNEPGISEASLGLEPDEEVYDNAEEEADDELISSLTALAEREERNRSYETGNTEPQGSGDYDDTVLFDDDYEDLE